MLLGQAVARELLDGDRRAAPRRAMVDPDELLYSHEILGRGSFGEVHRASALVVEPSVASARSEPRGVFVWFHPTEARRAHAPSTALSPAGARGWTSLQHGDLQIAHVLIDARQHCWLLRGPSAAGQGHILRDIAKLCASALFLGTASNSHPRHPHPRGSMARS